MQSQCRRLTLCVLLALLGVLSAGIITVSAQATDPRIGTWKLNAGKSKYDPGPPPQSLTVNVEPAGQGEKVTAEFVNMDGTRATTGQLRRQGLPANRVSDRQHGCIEAGQPPYDSTDRQEGRKGNSNSDPCCLSGRQDNDSHREGYERPRSSGKQCHRVR